MTQNQQNLKTFCKYKYMTSETQIEQDFYGAILEILPDF